MLLEFVASQVLSIGLILILGFIIGYLLNKIKIPGLIGMILVGILLVPALDALGVSFINISDELSSSLRQIALVVILTRSGLNLDFKSLKQIGRPAILMCFLPATFEIFGVTLITQLLIKIPYFSSIEISIFESMLLGSVLAAVSPAVVSPRMIKLIEDRYGEDKNIPKLILAGASCDDIYVIVLFYAFLGLVETGNFDGVKLALIPVSILSGILLGIMMGFFISFIIKKFNFNKVISILIILSSSFLMIGLEEVIKNFTSFDISALLGIMVMAMIILFKDPIKSKEISNGYNNIWIFFEIILFVLVGMKVNFEFFTWQYLLFGLIVIISGLLFRTVGVFVSLIKTNLNIKERLFVVFSYLPKATVQASIGGILLSVAEGGAPELIVIGELVLTIAVLSILITAPLGALLIDKTHKKLLKNEISSIE